MVSSTLSDLGDRARAAARVLALNATRERDDALGFAAESLEHHLDRIFRRAQATIADMRRTFDHQPEKARELIGALFDGKIIFRPKETSEGPRFELEGIAAPGRLLAVEGLAQAGVPKRASPGGFEHCFFAS